MCVMLQDDDDDLDFEDAPADDKLDDDVSSFEHCELLFKPVEVGR